MALLGRHNLKQHYERGMVSREIKQIVLHKDWKPYVVRYDADIAILVFNEEVQLSEYIKTICLPSNTQAQSLSEGEVVG